MTLGKVCRDQQAELAQLLACEADEASALKTAFQARALEAIESAETAQAKVNALCEQLALEKSAHAQE